MIELLVAAGLMTLVSVGVATAIFQVTANQNELNRKFDGSEFVAGLGLSLQDKNACKTYLSGKSIPTTTDFTPLTISGYKGFGDSATTPLASGYIVAGKPASPQVLLNDLSWRLKEVVPSSSNFRMTKNGVTAFYFKAPMQLRVVLSVNRNGQLVRLPERYLDYTVVAQAADRSVVECDGSPSVADTCAMLNAPINASGTCDLNVSGFVIRGSYIKSFCSPSGYTCRATRSSPSRVHDETKDYTCPANAQPVTTFNYTWVSQEQAGKKSSVNVTNTIQAYLCMSQL